MHWFVIVQIVISVLYVAYLIYKYSLKTVGPFVKISVYLTWLVCFSNVVLLPYDIYFSLQQDHVMGIVWKVSNSLIFLLTWLLLPIAQQYQQAGEFSIMQKLKRAIINNLIIYGIFLLVGALGLAYLIFAKKVDLANLLPVMLVASNAFGMLLVVIFLSHGLTAIPRSLWRYKNYKLKLKKTQFDASELIRKKSNILLQLELKVKEILWKIKKDGETIQTTEILNLVPHELVGKWNKNVPDLGQVNDVKVHKSIKNLTLQLARLQSRWQQLTINAFKIQDILTYIDSPRRRIQSTIFDHYQYEVLNYFQWVWHCRVKKILIPLIAILLTLFAMIIIIAQLGVFIKPIAFINPFSRLTSIKQFIWLDLVLLLVLGYMSFCIYFAMFKLKFSNYYGLYWNKQTDAASLIFFAINCSRISNPLNYNFLQIINDNDTSFVQAMGEAPLLGKTLQIVYPVLIIMLILFNACDMYTRVCKRLGLKKFQFQIEFSHENIQQGRKLLQKARTDLQTKILNSNCKNLAQFRSYKSEVPSGLYSFQHEITAIQTNKQSTSSDSIHLKPSYFNQFRDMEKVAKILEM